MIKVKNLKKLYGTFKAVDDISFEVKKGEIVGFLGPNGAGKSTTMKILTCFNGATEGSVSIAGFDVIENSFEVKKRIGYLPENAPLYPDMDVISYLKFIAEIREIESTILNSRLDEIINTCGLKKVLRKPISQLSKGYKQRVGLAQAMMHNPDVLILDEPTSGLDPNQIIEIRNLIKKIGKEKTVILSTHILPEVSATCDRVIIINEGKIVAEGTPDELSADSKELVVTTIRGEKDDITTKLNALEGVDTLSLLNENDNLYTFELGVAKGANINEALFKLAVHNNWILSELRNEGASLEDVFTELTRSEQ